MRAGLNTGRGCSRISHETRMHAVLTRDADLSRDADARASDTDGIYQDHEYAGPHRYRTRLGESHTIIVPAARVRCLTTTTSIRVS
jgi:hypothetical protein